MMAERADAPNHDQLLSDEEVRKRLLADPKIRKRAEELVKKARNGKPDGPGIKREELTDFLREHGLDPRQESPR